MARRSIQPCVERVHRPDYRAPVGFSSGGSEEPGFARSAFASAAMSCRLSFASPAAAWIARPAARLPLIAVFKMPRVALLADARPATTPTTTPATVKSEHIMVRFAFLVG